MQIFIKGASESIVAILLAHNGFLCTQATGRLAKIIFPSCLARLQLRNKLLVEARRRLQIIEASHPYDLFFLPAIPFFPHHCNCSTIAVTEEKETICLEGAEGT